MAVVHVLDDYYLAITAIVTVAYQLFFFSIAFTFKFDKLTGMSKDVPFPTRHRLSHSKQKSQTSQAEATSQFSPSSLSPYPATTMPAN